MSLITELLAVSESVAARLLAEELGNLNDLGAGKLINVLKQRFRETGGNGRHSSGPSLSTHAIGKKLNISSYYGVAIGPTSEIVDIPKMVDFADVRKAMRSHDGRMIALYAPTALNANTALMVLLDDESNISRPTGHIGFAWDFGPVMKKLDDEKKVALNKAIETHLGGALKRKGGRDAAGHGDGWNETEHITASDKTSSVHSSATGKSVRRYDKEDAITKAGGKVNDTRKEAFAEYEDWSDTVRGMATGDHKVTIKADGDEKVAVWVFKGKEGDELGRWNKKEAKGFITHANDPFNPKIELVYGEERNYAGVSIYVSTVKSFVEDVIKVLGKLSGKVVKIDSVSMKKRGDRRANPPGKTGVLSAEDMEAFKKDLATRLAKYKNSKLETAADASDFVKRVIEGGLNKLNFDGVTYVVNKPNDYYGTKMDSNSFMAGKPFEVVYAADKSAKENEYRSIKVTMKLVKGVLTATQLEYGDKKVAL